MELSKYYQIHLVILELLYNTSEYKNPNLIFPGLMSVAFPSAFLILVRCNVHASWILQESFAINAQKDIITSLNAYVSLKHKPTSKIHHSNFRYSFLITLHPHLITFSLWLLWWGWIYIRCLWGRWWTVYLQNQLRWTAMWHVLWRILLLPKLWRYV